jgi:hypothetical protein
MSKVSIINKHHKGLPQLLSLFTFLIISTITIVYSDGFSISSSTTSTTKTYTTTKFLQEQRLCEQTTSTFSLFALGRRRQDDDDDFYDDDEEEDVDDGFLVLDGESPRSGGRNRRPRRQRIEDEDYVDEEYDDLGYERRSREGLLNIPSSYGSRDGWRLPEAVSKSLLAGIFVLGIGLGVTIDSAINTNPKDLASRDAVDQAAPNARLCAEMGSSAMAFDQRVFVSFNPFNVYVAQADVKPACVLRQANVVPILRDRNLINNKEVASCKNNMNTWAFVGDLNDQPQLSCVYKSEDAQNEFLSNPKFGIGEDYLDDDRDQEGKKRVKSGLTDGQKAQMRKKANALPGLD